MAQPYLCRICWAAFLAELPEHMQVSPLGRLPVPAGSLWRIENVQISMLSFDWFVAQPLHNQASDSDPQADAAEPIRVEVVNSSIQGPKCAVHYENGMGASWIRSLNGVFEPVRPSAVYLHPETCNIHTQYTSCCWYTPMARLCGLGWAGSCAPCKAEQQQSQDALLDNQAPARHIRGARPCLTVATTCRAGQPRLRGPCIYSLRTSWHRLRTRTARWQLCRRPSCGRACVRARSRSRAEHA